MKIKLTKQEAIDILKNKSKLETLFDNAEIEIENENLLGGTYNYSPIPIFVSQQTVCPNCGQLISGNISHCCDNLGVYCK